MDYDQILVEVGEFGWFQRISSLLLWLPAAVGGIHALMFSFTGLDPKNGFRCSIPDTSYQTCDGDNFTFSDFPSSIFPDNSDGDPDYCQFKRPEVDPVFPGNCSHDIFTTVTDCPPGSTYAYNEFQFEETLVTRWDLVCDQQDKAPLVISMFMVGLMVGSFLFGWLADKIGRIKTLIISSFIGSVASLIGSWMPSFALYTLTRFLTGMGSQGMFLATFNLSMEIVGNKEKVPFLPWITYQTLLGIMIQAPFAIGMCLLSFVAMGTSTWYTLQWTVSAGTFVVLLLWFCIDESPRWLIASGRINEAEKLVKKIAKRNGRQLSNKPINLSKEEEDTVPEVDDKPTLGFVDLFRPPLLTITLVLFVAWPIVTLGYYGITFSMANLSDDLFMDFILSSLVEIPGDILALLLVDVIGRKPLFSSSLALTGFSCIAVGFLDKGGSYSTLRKVLALGGKMFAAAEFAVVYMYTAELFPTIVRSTAVGSCSLVARIGAISAPYIALLLPKVTNESMPYLVMGGLSVLGGILTLLLPETMGSSLPESIEDVEKIKKKSGKCLPSCSTGS